MSVTVYFVLIAALFLLGCPVAVTFLFSSLLYFLTNGLDLMLAVKIMMNGNLQFILLAVPFFIFAAQVMNEMNITDRMFSFADKLVGHIPGGLSHVNILTSVIFAGMSGSAVADTSGIGSLSAKAMIDKGFDKPYSVAVTISSSLIGPIIPPSIPMVIYASAASASVGALFVGAIVPGLLMALFLFGYCFVVSLKRGYPRSPRSSLKEILAASKSAFFPLMTPVILVGGIYTGVFTPTEAAAVASLYALVLAFAFDRNVSFARMARIMETVVKLTATCLILVASVSIFSWIVASERIPAMLTDLILGSNLNRYTFLFAVNIALLIAGCLLETNVVLIVFTPMLMPAVLHFGISPVHFGIVMVLNLMIGLNTPPFGLQLFIASGIFKMPINAILKETWPMLIALIAVLFLITFVEPLVMWLPSTMS